ncbi:histone deacetylase, putative [Plasmodium gallinaceum]|uniref:Histone deacetylase, putative n=1 Tax=Plasmodium gallinaceum TaxID=5849 RepID=A0A1J1H070_PLAGA|nr:histone deacetylase, putative [Plasmodium gallinaceum]CRG97842.1 histone deacetylase, putative [Plasmodium gallinaceum]
MFYYLLLLWFCLITTYKFKNISNNSNKVLKKKFSVKTLLYINLEKFYRFVIKKKKEKNKLQNSFDFYLDKFLYSSYNDNKTFYDLNKLNINSNVLSLSKDLLYVQNEINKNVSKSFNESKFQRTYKNQKRYSINSQNPPYVFHPIYSNVNIKKKHRFKIKKYENIFTYLNEANIYDSNFVLPSSNISEIIKYMLKAHNPSFINKMLNIIKNKEQVEMYELDLFPDLICRFLVEISGTILSSLLSLKYSISMHIGGGNHHSKRDRGDGFCIFNDVAIAIYFLLSNKIIENAVILDLDVHQGDGTAEIFENSKCVKTISLHCKNNYPLVKKNSTIDIELEPFIKDNEYLDIYQDVLKNIKKKEFSIIFYLAGVDISEDDDLGFLLISDEGIYKRDYLTYQMAIKNNIPIVTVLSGGYNECEETLTKKHILTFKAAKDSWNSMKK